MELKADVLEILPFVMSHLHKERKVSMNCFSESDRDYPVLLDLHTHSLSSGHGSSDTITQMAKAAAARGLEIMGLSEHGPATAGSVTPSYFHNLTLAPRKRFGVEFYYGAEVNIVNLQGDVDLEASVLSLLDYAIISIHPPVFTPYASTDLTDAYIAAMRHKNVHFLGHIDDARFPVDFERLLACAKEKGIYPEINNGSLMPEAYRVNGPENCRKILAICKQMELPVLLSSDSHGQAHVGDMQYIFPLLRECDFPPRLVLNTQPERIRDLFSVR
jgi:putative hydrolase